MTKNHLEGHIWSTGHTFTTQAADVYVLSMYVFEAALGIVLHSMSSGDGFTFGGGVISFDARKLWNQAKQIKLMNILKISVKRVLSR